MSEKMKINMTAEQAWEFQNGRIAGLIQQLIEKDARIDELEARTVTLPDERFRYGESDYDDGFANGWNAHSTETKRALAEAGISLKIEGE